MPRVITVIAIALSVLFWFGSTAPAQEAASTSVPNLMRFNGTVGSTQEESPARTVSLTFAIYKQQDGGVPIWQEIQNVTPDTDGLYSVVLGSTTSTGLPDDLFLQQEQRWLGVQVQGQTEQARVLLVSVPYAFKAHEAETLGGLPPSAFVKAPPSDAGPGTPFDAVSTGIAGSILGPGSGASKGKSTSPLANVCAQNNYQIDNNCNVVLSIDNAANPTDGNLFIGVGAGAQNGSNALNNTFSGYGAGAVNRTGSNNAYFGFFAGYFNTSSSNTFLGSYAGYNNIGTGNIFVGYKAGALRSTGNNDTFLGFSSGYSNTADGNTFVGYNSGTANTSGSSNTFLGNLAGTVNMTGKGNTFVGDSAGKANTVDSNTFIGYSAGSSNTTGAPNTFIGAGAGTANRTGNYNTMTGYNAGYANITGTWNTLYGTAAGPSIQTGNANTMFGVFAGYLTTGSNNTFVGANAGSNTTVGSNNIYLSTNYPGPASGAESNTIRLGNYLNSSYTQQTAVFIDPILPNNTNFMRSNIPVLTIVQPPASNAGQLGWQYISAGSGIGGNCAAGQNYVTKWLNLNTVQCSAIYEESMSGSNHVGIDGIPGNAQLDVVGGLGNVNTTNTLSSYMIGYNPVLSVYPNDSDNLFVGIGTGSGGTLNTFVGGNAGAGNSGGAGNTFIGDNVGVMNTTGNANTFAGFQAGGNNKGGYYNAFYGSSSGILNTTGDYNVFLGPSAGGNNKTGSSNIYIGNLGPSSGMESDVIRIGGDLGLGYGPQTSAYIAGVYASSATPTPPIKVVCVDSVGLLFGATFGTECTSSSRRFKENILDMDDSSSKLFKLHPVTFFYKPQYDDGSHLQQYGLIAEEVANVYPEMAAYDKDGQPYAVRYQMLAPMLLNELQKEHTVVMAQQDELQTQLQHIKAQQQQMEAQSQEIAGLRLQLQQQNASLQLKSVSLEERLNKLESYVATQTQMKTASDIQPATTVGTSGDSR